MGFEVVGLGLVAWELTRVQQRELGTPRWVRRLQARVRRLLGRPGVAHRVRLGEAVSIEDALGGRVWRGGGETVEQRLTALEADVETLRKQADERHADLEQRLTTQAQRMDALRADLERQHTEREAERREQLRESITLQWWGTGLFVIGAVLSGLANTC